MAPAKCPTWHTYVDHRSSSARNTGLEVVVRWTGGQFLDLGEVAGGGGDGAVLRSGGGVMGQQDGAGVPLGPGRHTTEHPAQDRFRGTGVYYTPSIGGQECRRTGRLECRRS